MATENKLVEILMQRRSVYDIDDKLPMAKAEVASLIKKVVDLSPTAFNGQTTRAVILFGAEHQTFWNEIVKETLRPLTPPERFGRTEQKLAAFAAGAGTILFFDDSSETNKLKEQSPAYAEHFTVWAYENLGLLEGNVWNALAAEKIGASLQHYNPVIDEKVKRMWHIPTDYYLDAQMVFGRINSLPEAKEKMPIDERVQIHGL